MLTLTIARKPLSFVVVNAQRAAVRGVAGMKALARALLNRREILRLAELDERGLKDIGLVRSDVDGALATSWLNDPSAVLAARSSVRDCVASARREEGLRRAALRPAAPRPDRVACSA